jgi:STE24 endopeptidase
MNESGPQWWIYVWAVWMGFSLLMLWAYPAFIAPIFNKFKPLEDQTMVTRIEALLDRCGFKSKGLFVMDGSKRSAHGNAYFSGIGSNKRIVFFDTLLEGLSPDEVEAVLAHELGHFSLKHVPKRIGLTAIITLIALALLGLLAQETWFFNALGVTTPSSYMALLLFMMVFPLLTFFIQPILAMGSRKHEFEADAFAAKKVDGHYLITALVKLYKENASTLTPDALYSSFHDSHPPAPIRIARLQQEGLSNE